MTSGEEHIFDMKRQGAYEWQIKQAVELNKQLEAKQKLEEQMGRGKMIREMTRTPAELVQKKIEELNELVSVGAISADTRARRLQQLRDERAEAGGGDTGGANLAGATRWGSSEAWNKIMEATYGGKKPMDEVAKQTKQIEANTAEARELLDEILNKETELVEID